MTQVNATLMAGERCDREFLNTLSTPESTKTHRPVSHGLAADLSVQYAKLFGYNVTSEQWGLNKSKTQLFGTLTVEAPGLDGMSKAIGVRNSHDKSFAFGMVAGVRVLVCSNLMFMTDESHSIVKRKHTSGIDLSETIPELYRAISDQYAGLIDNIQRLKDTKIESRAAVCEHVVDMCKNNILPSCDIFPVVDMFENPIHEEFSLNTEYSLYNCVNEIAKKYSAPKADRAYRGLARHFNLDSASAGRPALAVV